MLKRHLALIVLLIIALSAHAQYYKNIDTLQNNLLKAKNQRERFIILDAIGLKMYYQNGNADPKARALCDTLINIAKHLNNDSLLSRAYILKDVYYGSTGNNRLSLECIRNAIFYAKKAKYYDALSAAYKEHAIFYKELGMYDIALEKLLKSQRYLSSDPDRLNYMQPNRLYYNLSDVYLRKGDLDAAMQYCDKAYQCTKKETDPYGYIRVLDMKGKIHQDLMEYPVAESFFKTAIEFSDSTKLYYPLVTTSINYCHLLIKLHRYNDSKKYALYALERARQIKNKRREVELLTIVKDIYMFSGVHDSTYKYLLLSDNLRISVDSERAFNQIFNSVRDDEYQEKIEKEMLTHENASRIERIELSTIIIGILAFITAFLSLSRTAIINKKIIVFLSNIAFLTLFELLFFIIHKSMHGIETYIMFLILVVAAAILFPIHHYLQKIATDRLVKNNARIRLRHAEKILKEHENENGMM